LQRISSRACASLVLAALVAGIAGWLSSTASAELESLPPFVGSHVDQDALLEVISTAKSRSFKPVGHSSVVLRMRTTAHVTAGVKLRSKAIENGYRYEIAAYRLSRLLGLDNVPPAVYRRVAWPEVKSRFHEDKLDQRASIRRDVLWDDDGSAPAAAIYWVKGMRSIGLENRSTWETWLQEGEIPESRAALARDLSTMVVFDFLIGNWDRFSGGNLPIDSSREGAILRDNDRAFSNPLHERRYERLLDGLTRTRRFSKNLVRGLSELDERSFRAELAEDPSQAKQPLLNDAQIADIFERRATVLSYIAAMIEEHGESQVLFFP
jgi:hypothetical protein